MVTDRKKRILSGIQPTGVFTLGNYLGAVRNWPRLQDEFDCAYFIANLHAITVRQSAAELRQKTLEAYAMLLACGIDPQKSLVFIQSQVPTHAQASWILQCHTGFGELSRMTQFKEKSQKNQDNINAGLFAYPSLQAADILLYQADMVPVGEDQKQHLELTRDIAERFNRLYGDTFVVPDPYIPKKGARIMSLADPARKMSKSDDNPKATIFILEEPGAILKKCRSAVTDSEASVRYADGKDGINNLMTIYSCVTGDSFEKIEADFAGKGYGDFKTAVGEAVAEELKPVRDKYKELIGDKAQLEALCREGAEKAFSISTRTFQKMCKKVGLVL